MIAQQRQQQHDNHQQPICCANDVLRGASRHGSRRGIALVGNSNRSEQHVPCTSSIATDEADVLKRGQRSSEDVAQQAHRSPLLSSNSKENEPTSPLHDPYSSVTLRIPNAATKMSIDDRCTSEILGARTMLRALLNEQKKLGAAMRRRRLEACLGDDSTEIGSAVRRQRREPKGDSGYQRAARKKPLRKRGGRGKDVPGAATRGSHAHALVFMGEEALQKTELNQMRLEDAEATHLSR